jgi:transglutaminase-like putative cysteine protease
MRRRLIVALLLAGVLPLNAQAPRITTAGDPSIRADSIYKLAVDPKNFPEEDAAFLLDDGVLRLEANGRGTRTYRQIVQVLKQSAVERLQEQSWSYSPRHQKLTVNWVRVVRPDGRVVSAKPSHVQESDVPADDDSPVYSDRRVRRASLTGVAPGTLVDYSYTIEETKPFLPGDFYDWWGVSTGLQVARSRYIVDVPATLAVRLRELNLNFPRKERVANGRRTYEWATANLPKTKPEALAADSNGVYMSVAISSPTTWADIGRWYAALAKPHSIANKLVTARVDSVVRGARTRDDSIAAVHRWVAQDVRYVAIDLGMSGYQPRSPDVVTRTGFGDCKDKATLFVAALEHLGIQAFPVLLNLSGGVRREMPSIHQLNHEIAAVKRGDGYQFVDLTASLVPLGEIPFSEQGEFGLIVRPDGSSEAITLPKTPLTANRSETRIVGALSPEGTFNGTYEEIGVGAAQYGLRSLLENPLDSAQRRNLGNAIAKKLFESAEGDSLAATNGKDFSVTPRVTFLIRRGRAATVAGANMIFNLPLPNMSGMVGAAKELAEAEKRRFPIDPAKLWGERVSSTDILIALPTGWRAELPKSVSAKSDFGSFESQYTQEGQVLHLYRRITGAAGVQPPERIADLITWLRAVGADDAKFIVLSKSAGATQ